MVATDEERDSTIFYLLCLFPYFSTRRKPKILEPARKFLADGSLSGICQVTSVGHLSGGVAIGASLITKTPSE